MIAEKSKSFLFFSFYSSTVFAEIGLWGLQGLREAGAWTQVEHIWAEVSDDRFTPHPLHETPHLLHVSFAISAVPRACVCVCVCVCGFGIKWYCSSHVL